MKIVAAPDSYKGCLSAIEVARAMERGIKRADSKIEVVSIPFADGGEGTVEAMLFGAGGHIETTTVTGPLGDEIESFFGILEDGSTAVIEMAAASGLSLVPESMRNPMETTTYGTGQLILKAMDSGCRKIIVGVGGSSTNDGGTGMAEALGIKFFDKEAQSLLGKGKNLCKIKSFDRTGIDKRIYETEIIVACDVDNPFYGSKGAACIYAAQKGADDEMIKELDAGLFNLSSLIKATDGFDINEIPGAGAAGGLAGGLVAFAGAKLEKGIDIISKVCRLDERIKEADLVITGEGQTDYQTAFGKVPAGVAESAMRFRVPVLCISGSLGKGYEDILNLGVTAAFSIAPGPVSLNESMEKAAEYIENTTRSLVSLWLLGKNS